MTNPENPCNDDAKFDELMATPESHAFLDLLEEEAMKEHREGRTEEGGFGRERNHLIDESSDKPYIAGTASTAMAVLERFVFADSLNEAIEILTQDYELTEQQILAAIGFAALCVHDEYFKDEDAEIALTAEQLAEIEALKAMPDDQIDTSDIPEITDFTGFQRGLFYQRGTDHFSMKKFTEDIDSSIEKFIEHGEELRKTLKSGEKCTEIGEE